MVRVFIKSFGCSLNQADSEAMAGVLEKTGYGIVESDAFADVVVINSCIVKGHSQAQLFTYIERLKSAEKRIVVAGCGAQALSQKLLGYPLVGVRQIDKIPQAVEASLKMSSFSCLANEKKQRLALPKHRKNPVVEIIPISNGCLGSCSFCIVKKIRGSLESYPPEEIISSARSAVREGIKEIWLTAPDTACYGIDIKYPLPRLLAGICNIEGEFRVRLGMGNPDWFIKYIEALPELFANNKMFRFLHIPVQSGSDKILSSMCRNHSTEDYTQIVDVMRKAMPDMTISTDIIVGFPGETEEDFQKTIEILKRTKPDVLNLSRFTPRPGTTAESLAGQIKGDVKKERSRIVGRLHERISQERNNIWLGWKGKIIIDEYGKHDAMIGRNLSYKSVVVHGEFNLGEVIDVEIVEARTRFLRGLLLTKADIS